MNFAFITRRLPHLKWRSRRSDRRLYLGSRGERAAARHLRKRGYRIITRNYRCPVGEIDLISTDGDTVVFVEVKTRSSDEAEDPVDTVRPAKWARVERAARYFLMQRARGDYPCRFDVIVVVWPPRGSPRFEHFEDAYQPRRG